MSRKLLFISKYPDIIQEFLVAMDEKEVEIDIASNGIEAATLLKKNRYQVVVTGISMDGYNGEQIITFLNKNFPNTVCIIYTTTISPAQLHFFINERNVFRVFLRPVDFHKEFFSALEDAFEYYDVRVANQQEEEGRSEAVRQKAKESALIQQKLDRQKKMMPTVNRQVKRMMQLTLQAYADKLDAEQKEEVWTMECKAADLCLNAEGLKKEAISEAEALVGQLKEKIANLD